MENLSSRISDVCINISIGTATGCLEKDGPQLREISADLSVQLSRFRIRSLASWAGGQKQQSEEQLGTGGSGAMQSCSAHHGARAPSLSGRDLHAELKRKLGFTFLAKEATLNTVD